MEPSWKSFWNIVGYDYKSEFIERKAENIVVTICTYVGVVYKNTFSRNCISNPSSSFFIFHTPRNKKLLYVKYFLFVWTEHIDVVLHAEAVDRKFGFKNTYNKTAYSYKSNREGLL